MVSPSSKDCVPCLTQVHHRVDLLDFDLVQLFEVILYHRLGHLHGDSEHNIVCRHFFARLHQFEDKVRQFETLNGRWIRNMRECKQRKDDL